MNSPHLARCNVAITDEPDSTPSYSAARLRALERQGQATHGFESNLPVVRSDLPEDEIRSLAIAQRLLGTEEVILIHTDCGMLSFNDEEFKRQIQEDAGIKPTRSAEARTPR